MSAVRRTAAPKSNQTTLPARRRATMRPRLRSCSRGSSSGTARASRRTAALARASAAAPARHVIALDLLERAQPVVDRRRRPRRRRATARSERDRRAGSARAAARCGHRRVGRVVRRHHEDDAVARTAPDSRRPRIIASAMSADVELVEADGAAQRLRATCASGRRAGPLVLQRRELVVDVAHERVEVNARLAADRDGREERCPSGGSCRARRRPTGRRRAERRAAETDPLQRRLRAPRESVASSSASSLQPVERRRSARGRASCRGAASSGSRYSMRARRGGARSAG